MNWIRLYQAINDILSAGGKKAENLYRAAITMAVILILYNLAGMKKEQASAKELFANKLDSLRIEFVVYKEQEVGNWRAANNNFDNIDERFKEYDMQFVSYDAQLAAVRDNVFTILRGRYKTQQQ